MKTGVKIIFATLMLISTALVADWTVQNEKACDANTAGQFKYYTLSLSWSPEFCRSHPNNKEQQCTQGRELIVHGLWSECSSGYPKECKKGGVADTIDTAKIYPFMPSDFLIQHEWDTHGVCTGLSRSAFFDLTGKVFSKLKLPHLSGTPKASEIEAQLIKLNPSLKADQIYLSCTESGPKQNSMTLDEVRICIAKDTLEFIRCDVANVQDTCQKLKNVRVTQVK